MSFAAKIMIKALKFVGLVAVACVFGEVFIRVADPEPLIPRYVTGKDYGVRGNIPNARYWHVTRDVEVELRINSQGMRADREYPLAKPPFTCRIAMFGDSFFMGYELSLEDTFPMLIEKKMREKGYNVETLNFAVSGFGTAESIRTYQSVGRNFSPDFTLFQLHKTDPSDNVRANLFDFIDGTITPTGRKYLPAVKVQDSLMRVPGYNLVSDNSHLYSFIREWASIKIKGAVVAYKSLVARNEIQAAAASEDDEDDQSTYRFELTAALLKYARHISEADGAEFYTIDIPSGFGADVSESAKTYVPQSDWPALNIISPFPAFREITAKGTVLYFMHGHSHLTPTGTDILASTIVEQLLKSPKLNNCKI
jgi:hypothetical protein